MKYHKGFQLKKKKKVIKNLVKFLILFKTLIFFKESKKRTEDLSPTPPALSPVRKPNNDIPKQISVTSSEKSSELKDQSEEESKELDQSKSEEEIILHETSKPSLLEKVKEKVIFKF